MTDVRVNENKLMTEAVFLALVIWREARGEGLSGQVAVACSILNRVQRPSWWGKTVMEVLFKRLQYSSMTDKRDRQLVVWPGWDPIWEQCLSVAQNALAGKLPNPVVGADSYYDTSIPAPNWATSDTFVKQVGRIRFHNLDHDVEIING
jgi:spore germination cell wall hydrolase CwlJ-like protein